MGWSCSQAPIRTGRIWGLDTTTSWIAMRLGPLTNDGGHRRLNVLITRAKLRCYVFANFRADYIDLNRTQSRGVKALKTFLAYAESGILPTDMPDRGNGVGSEIHEARPDIELRVPLSGVRSTHQKKGHSDECPST